MSRRHSTADSSNKETQTSDRVRDFDCFRRPFTIPAKIMELLQSRQLTIADLLLLIAIESSVSHFDEDDNELETQDKVCWATNATLAATAGRHEKQISRVLVKLKRLGLLQIGILNNCQCGHCRYLIPIYD